MGSVEEKYLEKLYAQRENMSYWASFLRRNKVIRRLLCEEKVLVSSLSNCAPTYSTGTKDIFIFLSFRLVLLAGEIYLE